MNEAWKEHIQPIIDSYRGGNFSFIWDPIVERYPRLRKGQRTQVEDALVACAFDSSDDELAGNALAIARTLHTSHTAR